jgi:lipopolysaccharide export system ATP-binding protein
VVGLLGPNGAGKTTTFYMVVGIARPDSGQVFLGDEDITALPMYRRARAGIGYLPQEASVFRKLTAEQNVAAILEIILLDEPFAGIDPLAVQDIQDIIAHLKDRGIGVLVTDHNVRETLKIVGRAYILREGEVFRSGTPDELASDEEVRRVYLGEAFRLDEREDKNED